MPRLVTEQQQLVGLLHAMLAVTAPYLAPESLESRKYFPSGTPTSETIHPEHDFGMRSMMQPGAFAGLVGTSGDYASDDRLSLNRFQFWHRRKALDGVSAGLRNGKKMVQGVQCRSGLGECLLTAPALTLIAICDAMNGMWADYWMTTGAAMRMAVPMHLNLTSCKSSVSGLALTIPSRCRRPALSQPRKGSP